MTDFDTVHIQTLGELARQETLKPGWPFGGTGDWGYNVAAMLGGHAGEFAAAMSPDVADAMIAALRAAETKLAAVQALTEKWENATELTTGQPSVVTQAFAQPLRTILDGDRPES